MFATVAAVGNALFTYGQKKSANFENGLLFVSASALIAFLFAAVLSPIFGEIQIGTIARNYWKPLLCSGGGLFLTYLGFNLLYSRFGVSQYVLYAVISIITTTIIVGVWWLKEPINIYHMLSIGLAVISVFLFSLGQSRV